MIVIPKILLGQILAEAAAAPDREICGLLLGTPTRIAEAIATANVAADPGRTFEVDPAALFAALRAGRAGGPAVIGHYHSHPNGSAEPSPRDRAAAEPGQLWIIIGNDVARAWLAEATGFREMALVNVS